MTPVRTTCLLLATLLCSCASGEDSATPPAAAIMSVAVGRTPGKPMAFVKPGEPAERIEARKTKDGFELVVTRNVGQAPEDYVRTAVALTEDEWKQVLAVVEEHALRGWKPEPEEGRVFDWGEAQLELKTSAGTHAESWIKPLDNGDGVKALVKHLAKLAKDKVKKPTLYYMG